MTFIHVLGGGLAISGWLVGDWSMTKGVGMLGCCDCVEP